MADAAAKEPSMEDILSSIRKIIAEEGTQPPPPEVHPVTTELSEVPNDEMEDDIVDQPVPENPGNFAAMVRELPKETPEEEPNTTGAQAAELASSLAETASNEIQNDAAEDVVVLEEKKAELSSIVEEVAEPITPPPAERIEMINATPPPPVQVASAPMPAAAPAQAAVAVAEKDEVQAFKGALMSPSADDAVTSAFERLKRSAMDDIDAKTESILRPMLREWLDENLPSMVERLVREEIERVARGV